MGRGRAKAKQTKVARELKYSTGGTDLERLRAELVGSGNARENDAVADDEDDPYAAYVDPDEDDDR
ncbi:DUF3073 domain-containing protein [Sporichthya polymorpha]|uniref:DUF3073 domain-containing protein n=1 Tax=Sporichthya polymorpha TaxID=35751 RepID=UPI0003672320|nr:DUF3073 domain-containing protein [Sporichthya polymorpha]